MPDSETISAIAGIIGAVCVLALGLAGLCALILAGVNERTAERMEHRRQRERVLILLGKHAEDIAAGRAVILVDQDGEVRVELLE